jgi:hypothetical protein
MRYGRRGGDVLAQGVLVGFSAAARPVQAGPARLFLDVRRDPFFGDAEGALHGFKWTGKDAFADKNVQCIAVEIPDGMLGADPVIGVWATVGVPRDGTLVQVDRGGHPTINPFSNLSTPRTPSTPGTRPTTWRTTSNRGPACSKGAVTHARKRPRRR